jgi:hypothetical protein
MSRYLVAHGPSSSDINLMFPIRKFSFFYFISFPFLHTFPPSLIPIMSTEEVQISRKRAASEEVEVTV